MFEYLKSKLKIWSPAPSSGIGDSPQQFTQLKLSLLDNLVTFQGNFDGCVDFVHREILICGHQAALMMIDNLVDKRAVTQGILDPLTKAVPPKGLKEEELFPWLRDCVLSYADQKELFTVEEIQWMMMTGFVCLLIDGYSKALIFGTQSFPARGVEEPNIDSVMRGSREGFIEPLHLNISLIRRRLKNPDLKFESFMLGKQSKTEVCIAYLKGVASESVLESVRHRMKTISLDAVLASGYIQNNFQDHPGSIFPTVGYTERPDTLCGKMMEGRIGILVDGTPMAIFTPFLFIENFQNIDDYAVNTYYATFTRILKYIAFFISILLPGLYVAVGSFQQALLPAPLLYTLAQAEEGTPFPLVFEAILMQVIYEIMREAGLRAPKQIGSSLNIVGAFLIGQAAVSAGLIGAPMVIVVSLTATTSLVVPTLYEPGVILRFLFIFLAGAAGFYGIALGIALTAIAMCSIKTYEIPYTAPLSPFHALSMRDVVWRAPWKVLSKKRTKVQDLPGSDASKNPG